MKKWIILMAVLVSVACNSEKSAIKEALKESLDDPGSLIIDKVVTSEDSRRACIKYNSKNKFGIYVGEKTVVLKKISTRWAVQDTDVYASSCTNAGFKQLDEMEALDVAFNAANEMQAAAEEFESLLAVLFEAREVAVSAIQNGQNITREDAISSLKEGKCSNNFKLFEMAFVNRAESTVTGGDSNYWNDKMVQLLKTFEQGHC
jgi:hypothetical protein